MVILSIPIMVKIRTNSFWVNEMYTAINNGGTKNINKLYTYSIGYLNCITYILYNAYTIFTN